MINVKHLAVFRAVMKTGSVSAAARLLAVSQPAVTKTLQQIEWEIGVPLFQRLKGRLHPTPEGILLMPKVDQVFGAVEDVEKLAREIGGGAVGHVSVAVATTLAISIATAAVAEYRVIRPQAQVLIHALATRQVIAEVANNQVDIGLTDAATPFDGTLRTEELCKAHIGCVVARDHRLAQKSLIEPEDLKGENIITFFEDTLAGMRIRQWLGTFGLRAAIPLATNQSMIVCILASKGLGVGLIDPFTPLSDLFPHVVIKPLAAPLEIRPRLVFPTNRPLSIAATEFVQIIRRTFATRTSGENLIFPL